MSNVGTNGNTGIPNTEELVDKPSGGNEDDADEPSTESARGDGRVIVVVDDSPYFGVWGILH